MLLTALAIAIMKADAAAPRILLSSDRTLIQTVRKCTGSNRVLLTAKLSTDGTKRVRQALNAIPAQLYTPDDSKNLILDTGCSSTATGFKDDFIPGTLVKLDEPKPMDGVGGTMFATHVGQVRYEALDDSGQIQGLEGFAFYVPGMDCRLFGVQDWLMQKVAAGLKGYRYHVTSENSKLHLGSNCTITIPHDYLTRLPILRCFSNVMQVAESMAMACVTDEFNQNLTQLQKSLLQWHWKLGHVGFQQLQWIGRQGWLGKTGERFGISSVHPPKCGACQFGKQDRNPKAGSTTQVDTEKK